MLAPLLFLVQNLVSNPIHVKIEGVDRQALVFLPTHQTSAKPPILFAFHGHGGSAERLQGRSKLEELWPEAIVIFPIGLPTTHKKPPEEDLGWVVDATESNRDLKLFDALRKKAITEYNGDPKHLFAFGFSYGAIFMYTLWNMRGKELAGLGSAEGCMMADLNLSPPKPFFMTIGSEDEAVPTEYQLEALKQVKKTNDSEVSGTPYGPGGLYIKGTQPILYWPYKGGHDFPLSSLPSMVRFFQEQCK